MVSKLFLLAQKCVYSEGKQKGIISCQLFFLVNHLYYEFKESVSIDETDNSDKNVKLSELVYNLYAQGCISLWNSGLKYLLV